jgi:DNA-binding MurR/RpiR family transcriptional regulator
MSLRDPRQIGPAIRSRLPELTALETRIVDLMLTGRRFNDGTALADVARDAAVSEAMVVKLAKKLGFAGFREMRSQIVAYNELPTAELHEQLTVEDGGDARHPRHRGLHPRD